MNDADIETAHMNAIADHESRLAKKGICCHGHLQCAPGNGRKDGKALCLMCGKIADEEELWDEREERPG